MNYGNTCPCCGWDGLELPAYRNLSRASVSDDPVRPPYSRYLGYPSYEVCACCGFEFGNDDEPGTGEGVSFKAYLAEWIKTGSSWFDPTRRPHDWSLERQLAKAGIKPPVQN